MHLLHRLVSSKAMATGRSVRHWAKTKSYIWNKDFTQLTRERGRVHDRLYKEWKTNWKALCAQITWPQEAKGLEPWSLQQSTTVLPVKRVPELGQRTQRKSTVTTNQKSTDKYQILSLQRHRPYSWFLISRKMYWMCFYSSTHCIIYQIYCLYFYLIGILAKWWAFWEKIKHVPFIFISAASSLVLVT